MNRISKPIWVWMCLLICPAASSEPQVRGYPSNWFPIDVVRSIPATVSLPNGAVERGAIIEARFECNPFLLVLANAGVLLANPGDIGLKIALGLTLSGVLTSGTQFVYKLTASPYLIFLPGEWEPDLQELDGKIFDKESPLASKHKLNFEGNESSWLSKFLRRRTHNLPQSINNEQYIVTGIELKKSEHGVHGIQRVHLHGKVSGESRTALVDELQSVWRCSDWLYSAIVPILR